MMLALGGRKLTREMVAAVRAAALDVSRVRGLTHRLYQYPARFSPTFAREVIKAFSDPGDVVLDPFVGGGTTIVEGLVLGRRTVGIDINQLAVFVTRAKSIGLRETEAQTALRIATSVARQAGMSSSVDSCDPDLTNLDGRLWRIRRVLSQMRSLIHRLPNNDVKTVLLSSLIRTAQLGLDRKRHVPTLRWLRRMFVRVVLDNLEGSTRLRAIRSGLNSVGCQTFSPFVVGGDAEFVLADYPLDQLGPPKLVLTSPPYPGVHVLYHRWQVFGRKETNAPYWLANIKDGQGASHYTFGDRKRRDQSPYFKKLLNTFMALRRICSKATVVVQLVGFSDQNKQLPQYLDTMRLAGFGEWTTDTGDAVLRIERTIPNRRWYSQIRAESRNTELLLVHFPN